MRPPLSSTPLISSTPPPPRSRRIKRIAGACVGTALAVTLLAAVPSWASDITISFNTGGHGQPIPSQTCPQGVSCLELPTPVARDWYFLGWFMDSDGTLALDSQWVEGGGFDVNTTLFASWTAGLTVDWNLGGQGTTTSPYTVVRPNTPVSPLPNSAITPATPGSVLEGWYSNAQLTTPYNFNSAVTTSMTLYAKFVAGPTPTPSMSTPQPGTQTPTPSESQSNSTAPPTTTAPPTATPSQSTSQTPTSTKPVPTNTNQTNLSTTPGRTTSAATTRPATTGPATTAIKPNTSPSEKPPAALGKATVTVKLAAKSIKAGARAKVTVKVKVKALTKPTGKVKLTYGKKAITKTVKTSAKGKLTLRLAKLKRGTYKVAATFTPAKNSVTATKVAKSKSKTVKLKVR